MGQVHELAVVSLSGQNKLQSSLSGCYNKAVAGYIFGLVSPEIFFPLLSFVDFFR